MSKLSAKDLVAIKETITHTGEVRFHILYSRSNLTVRCRLWHPDGHVLGTAHGGGYDRAGAALGQAIEALFPEELKGLKAGYDHLQLPGFERNRAGLYGLTKRGDGRMSLDGSCGVEQMLKVLEALGFADTEKYETGKSSSMVVARMPRKEG